MAGLGQHFESLDEALGSLFGDNIKIAQMKRIFGGDINESYGLTLTDGTYLFMKSNTGVKESFFTAEAEGLKAIASTRVIGTPHILCSGTDRAKAGGAFLLLEYIRSGERVSNYWEIFAQQLAAMHQAETAGFLDEGVYGFAHDNYIGARNQCNTPHNSWICFFRDCRLKPQLKEAAGYFDSAGLKKADKLLERLEDILVEPEHPSLLHGDLWSGNVITGNDGKAWLIDPAVYVGHAEADLAMTELFGGFPPAFYDAYKEAAGIQPGYAKRRDLYNLYHLLNHLNMFGRSYYPSVKRIIDYY